MSFRFFADRPWCRSYSVAWITAGVGVLIADAAAPVHDSAGRAVAALGATLVVAGLVVCFLAVGWSLLHAFGK